MPIEVLTARKDAENRFLGINPFIYDYTNVWTIILPFVDTTICMVIS